MELGSGEPLPFSWTGPHLVRGLTQQSAGTSCYPIFSECTYPAIIHSAIREGVRERMHHRLGGDKPYTRGQFLHSDGG